MSHQYHCCRRKKSICFEKKNTVSLSGDRSMFYTPGIRIIKLQPFAANNAIRNLFRFKRNIFLKTLRQWIIILEIKIIYEENYYGECAFQIKLALPKLQIFRFSIFWRKTKFYIIAYEFFPLFFFRIGNSINQNSS